jgi:NAD-dependent DNA ligase
VTAPPDQADSIDPHDPHDPQVRIAELTRQIRAHDEAYYAHDAPEIPDAEYDELVRELRALEEANPELASPESPTQHRRWGGTVGASFAPVTHRVPMTSSTTRWTPPNFGRGATGWRSVARGRPPARSVTCAS